MAKKGTDPRRGRKNMRFEKLHPGMTRTQWAKEKREKKRLAKLAQTNG